MQIWRPTLTAAALLLSVGAAAAAPAVVRSDLNMRSGPGPRYAVVNVIPGGTTVDVRGCTGSWCRVVYAGSTGYASRSYLGAGGGVAESIPAPGPYAAYDDYDDDYASGPYYDDYGYYGAPVIGFGVASYGHRRGFGRRHWVGRGSHRWIGTGGERHHMRGGIVTRRTGVGPQFGAGRTIIGGRTHMRSGGFGSSRIGGSRIGSAHIGGGRIGGGSHFGGGGRIGGGGHFGGGGRIGGGGHIGGGHIGGGHIGGGGHGGGGARAHR